MSQTKAEQIRILLIDHHIIVRSALRLLIEADPGCTVIGEAADRAGALEAARSEHDVIISELDLGSESALDFLPELQDAADGAGVLILTGVSDHELHCRAVCLGAMGVVHKAEAAGKLLEAIRSVHAGEAWLSPSITADVLKTMSSGRNTRPADPKAEKIAKLTARERDVIALIGEGMKNKRIADRLFLSEPTVRRYLGMIFDKLEVSDRLELAVYAFQHGLAKLPYNPTMRKFGPANGKAEGLYHRDKNVSELWS